MNTDLMRIPATIEDVPVILEFIETHARACGLGETEIRQLELACEEIVVNVVRHAYRGAAGDIAIRCHPTEGGIEVEIVDWGPSFDILAARKPDLTLQAADRPIGGLGVFLACRMTDALTWRREGDRNVVRILKRKSP